MSYTKVTKVINDLADVDTVTIPPIVNQPLIWDGTNWIPRGFQKVVTNLGTTTPIATIADGGLVDAFPTDGIWRQRETNDILPVNVAADVSSAWYIRPSLTFIGSINNIPQQRVVPNVRTPIILNNPLINVTTANDGGMVTINATNAIINVPGVWHISATTDEGIGGVAEEPWPAGAFLELALITPVVNILEREKGDFNQYSFTNTWMGVDITARFVAGAVIQLTYAPFLFNFSRPVILRKFNFVRLSE